MKTGPAAMEAARALGLKVPQSSSPGVAEVFSAPTRRELAGILPGGMEAARRIEADCCLLLNHGFHERSPEDAVASARKLLNDADAMARAADAMFKVYEATERYSKDSLHSWLGFDEEKWHEVFTHIGGIAGGMARLRERLKLEPALRPGRRMAPGMLFIGANLCKFLEREGLRRSRTEDSPMVRAVDLILQGVGLAGPDFSAEAFVRTVSKPDKSTPDKAPD